MRFNIYWHETHEDGIKSFANQGLTIETIKIFVDIILSSGGEITGIINEEEDK